MLAEAQKLGYAEADPSFDIDGVDAAHKLAILAALAFGCQLDFAGVSTPRASAMSRRSTSPSPSELGYRIKLLGIARLTEHGLEQRVHPCMVPIGDADRAGRGRVQRGRRRGRFRRPTSYRRPRRRRRPDRLGGGRRPHRHRRAARALPAFGVPARRAERAAAGADGPAHGAYYFRLMVVDRPGVIADVAAALRDEEVSIEAMIQRGAHPASRCRSC